MSGPVGPLAAVFGTSTAISLTDRSVTNVRC
jgi:hypothetical protein